MTTREQKKLQTRHAFFQAALNLCMSGQSFSSISLRQVTREVGVVPTAFYRHFNDMEALGKALIEELIGSVMSELAIHMNLGSKRDYDKQLLKSVALFFKAIDAQPNYWHFFASERFGGSTAVCQAIQQQIQLFIDLLGEDLTLQPQFNHIENYDLQLLSEMGINLSFSWIIEWLELDIDVSYNDKEDNINNISKNTLKIAEKKQALIYKCTRQTQMLFYGAYNWQSSEET